jgi:hypothetical protein
MLLEKKLVEAARFLAATMEDISRTLGCWWEEFRPTLDAIDGPLDDSRVVSMHNLVKR